MRGQFKCCSGPAKKRLPKKNSTFSRIADAVSEREREAGKERERERGKDKLKFRKKPGAKNLTKHRKMDILILKILRTVLDWKLRLVNFSSQGIVNVVTWAAFGIWSLT